MDFTHIQLMPLHVLRCPCFKNLWLRLCNHCFFLCFFLRLATLFYQQTYAFHFHKPSTTSFIYMENSVGTSTVPCGIPQFISHHSVSPILTLFLRLYRHLIYHWFLVNHRPKSFYNTQKYACISLLFSEEFD